MYLLKLGILVVGELSWPLKGLWKLDVGVYSDTRRLWGAVMTAEVSRLGGSGCWVQLRRAGPAVDESARIVTSGG